MGIYSNKPYVVNRNGGEAEGEVAAVQAYIRARLRAEIVHGPRGTASLIAQATGLRPPTITNMIHPDRARGPGLAAIHALASYWGLDVPQLWALALGLESGGAQ